MSNAGRTTTTTQNTTSVRRAIVVGLILGVMPLGALALAQSSDSELAKQLQNPVAALMSVPDWGLRFVVDVPVSEEVAVPDDSRHEPRGTRPATARTRRGAASQIATADTTLAPIESQNAST